jgi:hypothetical protein
LAAGRGQAQETKCGRYVPGQETLLRPVDPSAGVAADHISRQPHGFRVEMRATLLARCGGALEDRRDLLDLVKLARGDLDGQVVGLVVGERQAAAVEAVEGDRRCKR